MGSVAASRDAAQSGTAWSFARADLVATAGLGYRLGQWEADLSFGGWPLASVSGDGPDPAAAVSQRTLRAGVTTRF